MTIGPNPVYRPNEAVDKSAALAKGVFRVGTKNDLRNYDWTAAGVIYVANQMYYSDPADTTSDDNDSTVIVDQTGMRWKRGTGGALSVHAAGLFEDREDYNAQKSPRPDGSLFVYFSTNGDGGTITDGVFFFKLSDGDTWSDPVMLRGPRGGERYEIFNWDTDRPASGEEVVSVVFTTDVTFPADFLGSRAKARVASTGAAVYSIQKNDVQIGTITFATSTNGVFALTSETSFTSGDRMSVVAPAPRDPTLSGVVTTIVGTR